MLLHNSFTPVYPILKTVRKQCCTLKTGSALTLRMCLKILNSGSGSQSNSYFTQIYMYI